MYKGYRFSKRLERYVGYAKANYHEALVTGSVNLWDILNEYSLFRNAPYCIQMYVHDLVKGTGVYTECYELIRWSDGRMYVREVVGMIA